LHHRFADIRPAGILVPQTTGDIRAAILWARAHDIPLAPRSSLEHNYAGYSAAAGLLLILSRMRGIQVRPVPTRNFRDPDLKDWRRSYYGDNYPRLVPVKHAYGPTGFFSYGQGIGRRADNRG
jgi:hypothetical protein